MVEPGNGVVQGWIDLFRSLGSALLGVLRAEAQALGADFRRSGHLLGRGLALLGAAAGVLFWTLGVVIFTLVAVLALWLPLWAAALIAAALFAAAGGLLALLGLRQLRQLESPAEDIRRRVSDHLDWWQSRLLAEPPAVVSPTPPPVSPTPPGTPSPPAGGGPMPPRPDRAPPPPRPGRGAPPPIHPADPLEDDEP